MPLAWAVARTDMPGKGAVRLLVLGAFVTPPYLGALGWILLAGPNAGWLNRIWKAATGAPQGLFDIYTFTGLGFVIALYSFPYIFIFTTSALEVVSSEMEDAANILGAGTVRTMLRITLPMVLPAILGGAIVTFLEAIALFGSPALIAIPARFNVVTTQLLQFFSPPIRTEVACAYAMPLLLITVVLFLLQRRLTGRRGYVAMTGKGGDRRIIALGPWRWVMTGYAVFVLSLSVLLPYAAMAQAALAKAWGRGWHLDNLTLQQLHLPAVPPRDRRPVGDQQLHLCRRRRGPGADLVAVDRLHRRPPPAARRRRARLSLHGAVRRPRRRAGGRVLCRLCATAILAVWHCMDPDPGVHHPVSADRLRQRPGRHPVDQSGDGRSGARARRQPSAWRSAACWRR